MLFREIISSKGCGKFIQIKSKKESILSDWLTGS